MGEGRGIGGVALSLVTLLVTVIGAGVAFLEYRAAQERERVERVFRYSDALAKEIDANTLINKLGDDFIIAVRYNDPTLGADPSSWIVRAIEADPALRIAVDRMAMFYDTLAVCVTEGLCDEATAKALFTQQVAGFAATAYPWVAHRDTQFFAPTGTRAVCLRNRFCGGETECTSLPVRLAPCE